MGQDVESSGRRGEEMALFACAATGSPRRGGRPADRSYGERGGIGMGQGVESSRAPGWFPWVFGFLLRLHEFMFGRKV